MRILSINSALLPSKFIEIVRIYRGQYQIFQMIFGRIDEFISKINDDFQEAIEKLAVQSKSKIVSATAQLETIAFDCQGN